VLVVFPKSVKKYSQLFAGGEDAVILDIKKVIGSLTARMIELLSNA
jgi:hypothetical protein